MDAPTRRLEADVAVIGGAFAASATALLIKRMRPRTRVVLVDSTERFDRKVGESSVELSTWFMTCVLGLRHHLTHDQLPKFGLRFWFHKPGHERLDEASELGPKFQSRVPSHHIDRALLDEHVHGLARDEGVEILRPARVMDVELREGALSTLHAKDAQGTFELHARWVIDGSGRKTVLGRKLGLHEPLQAHPTHSVWARYRGVGDIDDGRIAPVDGRPQDTVFPRALSTNHLTGPGWWAWIIPLPGGDTSVGIVWDERILELKPGPDLAERFEEVLRSVPVGRSLMQNAERVDGELKALRRLPYRMNRVQGDGWALVGDAAGFLDPFYSPGLDWGSITAAYAARTAVDALEKGETCPKALASTNAKLTKGFERWFEAIYRDKYYYMGDADLMDIALRMDVSLYYVGVIFAPYQGGLSKLLPPYTNPGALPFYLLMKTINRRLAALGKARMRAGTWGRHNAGRRVLIPGFTLGPRGLNYMPGILWRWMRVELAGIVDRVRARGRALPGSAPVRAASVGAQADR